MNDHRGILLEQLYDDIPEVRCIGSEADGNSVTGRFNHVLATSAPHAATHEADRGQSPPGPQFSHDIDQQQADRRIVMARMRFSINYRTDMGAI